MKNMKSRVKWLIILLIVIVLGTGMIVTITASAQNQNTSNISDRLADRGVPVKHVKIISRLPYEVEIALQSSSENDRLSVEDNWFMQLARREATLAYRTGARLNSFHLVVFNAKDELIYSTQTYLYPEDLSQQTPVEQIYVDNQTAKGLIKENLQFGELSINLFDVITEDVPEFGGQILLIQISAKDIDEANRSLPNFLGSLFATLETINMENNTNIVLCHLRLINKDGKVLLDYVEDLESGTSQWTSAEGLYNEWYSQPEVDEAGVPTPTLNTLQKTPTENEPYPAPRSDDGAATQQPILTPYP